jgi:Ni,Fe-hydrogenase III component G
MLTETQGEILTEIRNQLGDRLVDLHEKSDARIYMEVAPDHIVQTVQLVFKDLGGRLQIASGVDTPDTIEILYHFAFDAHGFLVTVRTKLDREDPVIDSVADICKGAEWIEREMWELLGIQFRNHPDMRHLLLKDDWPEGKFPLRRDYQKDG